MPEERRWVQERIAELVATPWGLKANAKEGVEYTRRGYITKALVTKHGKTAGCPKCFETGVHHTETCRKRFEEIWDQRQRRRP